MTKVFKFALVARGPISLAKYPKDDADLYDKTLKILRKLDPSAPFSVVEQQNLLFTTSTTQDGLSFVCICDKNVETRRVGQFLNALKSKWIQSYGATLADIPQDGKDDEFQPSLKDLIDHYNTLCPPAGEVPPSPRDPEVPSGPAQFEPMARLIHEEPDIVEEARPDESLAGLRVRIWWQRYGRKVLIVIGLVIFIYLLFAWYCGDLTLAKCF
jgi:hypothetical protein